MNVSRLQAAAAPSVQREVKDAEEKEADVRLLSFLLKLRSPRDQFLALRLLNKKARIRLSPSPLKLDALSGKGALFATANETGCFAAATCSADGQHSTCGRKSLTIY